MAEAACRFNRQLRLYEMLLRVATAMMHRESLDKAGPARGEPFSWLSVRVNRCCHHMAPAWVENAHHDAANGALHRKPEECVNHAAHG
ncbi:hypothetical protein [Xanthomonas melonis]|uniref:hypothetical protein n=1 Tax=Xanthomonas melonis TaxID=56456 RepID=UPI001E3B385F|nr:hypothetical protein [Xanthomonas melonis]MCD0245086.1 hypothetical protein [Xanthomonas melonis]